MPRTPRKGSGTDAAAALAGRGVMDGAGAGRGAKGGAADAAVPGNGAGRDGRPRQIPEATIARLPVYQRILADMQRSGATTVSSDELAARAQVNAAKVRKDFSLFGSFGTRGTGYDVAFLAWQIEHALGADRDWPVVVVGIGNLGRALANSDGFSSHGFRVTALFDIDEAIVGSTVASLTVRHVEELGSFAAGPAGAPAIGVIAAPASAAQAVADALVDVGTASILNFAPRMLDVPTEVLVRHVDLSVELQVMSFLLARREAERTAAAGTRTAKDDGPRGGPRAADRPAAS